MHVKYAKVLYLSKESIFQGTHSMAELVRPNIQKKIADVRTWDDIMHKVHNGTVFIKGIYTSGNSRMAELVRPNIPKKIVDVRAWDDIMHKVHNGTCIYQRNLYFRELTHDRTGSPEHPKENSRYMLTWDDIMHVKYAKVLYLSKESILQGTHAWPNWFARTSKRK